MPTKAPYDIGETRWGGVVLGGEEEVVYLLWLLVEMTGATTSANLISTHRTEQGAAKAYHEYTERDTRPDVIKAMEILGVRRRYCIVSQKLVA